MTENQLQMLRCLIQDEIECAGIDGFEHGAWGWAEKQLNENWKKFQESFADPDQQEYTACDHEEENTQEEISEEENLRRFKKVVEWMNNLQPGDLTKLMGEEFMKEFRQASK
jgi:hypothetical protein